MILDLILGIVLACSLGVNVFCLFHIKSPKKKIAETYDVQALLRDLATGPGLVKIEYVDRSDLFLRSPRDR